MDIREIKGTSDEKQQRIAESIRKHKATEAERLIKGLKLDAPDSVSADPVYATKAEKKLVAEAMSGMKSRRAAPPEPPTPPPRPERERSRERRQGVPERQRERSRERSRMRRREEEKERARLE